MIGLIKKSFGRLPDLTEKGARLNFPNLITLLRVTVIPVLFFLLLSPGRDGSLIIAGLFVLAALTDLLDGYLA
ncbi:MAG: CDP-alcohol phosphatidyltransferase family protein, partial [Syntrophales bacterium]